MREILLETKADLICLEKQLKELLTSISFQRKHEALYLAKYQNNYY